MNKGSTATGVVIAAAVALIVGGFGGYAIAMNNDDKPMTSNSQTKPSTMTKAADLRSDLVTLGVEHMNFTNKAVASALDGNKDADAAAVALYANGKDIGAAVGSVYGKDAQTTFDAVWKLHLDEFVKYAVASSKGDDAAKQAALDAIDTGYTKPLSQFLAKANPNLPQATLESGLREHVIMTAKMFDLHVAGDYTGEAAELKMANKHMEAFFSTLAGGIVAQFPEKF